MADAYLTRWLTATSGENGRWIITADSLKNPDILQIDLMQAFQHLTGQGWELIWISDPGHTNPAEFDVFFRKGVNPGYAK